MSETYDWQVGDPVFAPWEPQWLYPGTVLCIDEDVAFLRFDDGDRIILPLSALRSVAIRPGDKVQCRRERELKVYTPARVLGMTDDGLRVEYADGDKDLVPLSHCRIAADGQEGERQSFS